MKKLLELAICFLIGVGIGSLVEMFISIMAGQYVFATSEFLATNSPVFTKIIQTFIYGGFGVVGVLGSALYDNEKVSLLFATLLHLFVLITYYVIVGVYLRWFDLHSIVFPILIFTIIYFVIWTFFYINEKRKFEKINKKLSRDEH